MPRRHRKRKRPGYVRPSRAKPKPGWTLRQLAALSGLQPRSIKLHLERGVIPRPPFKGSATRYQRPHLLRLIAARRLLTSERLTLLQIRGRLQSMSETELETFATEALAPGPVADALGVQVRAVAVPAEPPTAATLLGVVPRWVRVELALGLELHVREDASATVLELAARVRGLCGGG